MRTHGSGAVDDRPVPSIRFQLVDNVPDVPHTATDPEDT
jgi:hypothetical protein